MKAPRALATIARTRRSARRDADLDRVVRRATSVHDGGQLVTDVSSGYDNRAMGWHDHDDARPTIGFRAVTNQEASR